MDKFRAGNVKKFLPNWQQITKNSEILETVQGDKIPFYTIPPSIVKDTPKFTQPETDAIDNEISKLLQKGVVKPPYHEEGEFISPIFVTPKSDGGYRLILNLKSLNEYIDIEHFKMHGLKEILKLVERNCYMAALDIKDAYYSIPVEASFQKYLKFVWKGILHQFCMLPNRLSPCPRWFTKISKPPLAELRELKHDISAYIDDMYLQGNTKTKCVSNIVATIKKLRSLGFTIHEGKSNLIPTQKLDILGFTIDSVAMTVSLKETKKKDLSNLISKTIAKTFIKIRKLSQVIEKIVAALPGSMYGALYYRHIELNKQHGLKHTKGNYKGYVKITKQSLSEHTWWKETYQICTKK